MNDCIKVGVAFILHPPRTHAIGLHWLYIKHVDKLYVAEIRTLQWVRGTKPDHKNGTQSWQLQIKSYPQNSYLRVLRTNYVTRKVLEAPKSFVMKDIKDATRDNTHQTTGERANEMG